MAEGLIGGVIGDEEESSEAESDALAGADAFAAAIAARLSANDPGVSRKTEEFLAEQTRLVAVQRAILKKSTRCGSPNCGVNARAYTSAWPSRCSSHSWRAS